MKIKTAYFPTKRRITATGGPRSHVTAGGKGGVESIELATVNGVSGVLVTPNPGEANRAPSFILDVTHVDLFPEPAKVQANPAADVSRNEPDPQPEPEAAPEDLTKALAEDAEDTEPEEVALAGLGVKELRKKAAKLGLRGDKMRKDALVAAIEGAQG